MNTKHKLCSSLVLSTFTFCSVVSAQAEQIFPEVIPLPNGFQPEGVTAHGLSVLAGSLLDGDIYQASVITGEGRLLVDAPEGRTAIGIEVDHRGRLFVAGGPYGRAYAYDAESGAPLAEYQLGPENSSLINDLVTTREAVYFTDSFNPVIYRLSLGRDGDLPGPGAVETIAVTGPAADDFLPGEFNFNGIEYAPWARSLIVTNYTRGNLYVIDPRTGESSRIDLNGATVDFADGVVLRGLTLYVVQNNLNAIAAVQLSPWLGHGRVVDVITDPDFKIPTTADAIGPYLFAVNARFDVAPPPLGGTPPADPDLEYDIIRVRAAKARALP